MKTKTPKPKTPKPPQPYPTVVPDPSNGLFRGAYLFELTPEGKHPFRCLCCKVYVPCTSGGSYEDHEIGCPAKILLQIGYRATARYRDDSDDRWEFLDCPVGGDSREALCQELADHVSGREIEVDACIGYVPYGNLDYLIRDRVQVIREERREAAAKAEKARRDAAELAHWTSTRDLALKALEADREDLKPAAYKRRLETLLTTYQEKCPALPPYKAPKAEKGPTKP